MCENVQKNLGQRALFFGRWPGGKRGLRSPAFLPHRDYLLPWQRMKWRIQATQGFRSSGIVFHTYDLAYWGEQFSGILYHSLASLFG